MPVDAVGHGTNREHASLVLVNCPFPSKTFSFRLFLGHALWRTPDQVEMPWCSQIVLSPIECRRFEFLVVSISVRRICPPESIGNNIESPYVLVHDRLLPSPNGGTFPSIWTYSSHSKGVLLAMVHPSSNRIVCQLMFISHSNKLGFYLT